MNRERLEHLITVARAIPPTQFFMQYFRCGTSMCLAGWAAVDPTFNEQGFKWIGVEPGNDHGGSIVFEQHEYWNALRKFFDLTNEEADYLFLDDGPYTETIDQMVKRIEDVLRGELIYVPESRGEQRL